MTVTIGIDPHKSSHTAVAIDANENVIDEIKIRSCSTQAGRLRIMMLTQITTIAAVAGVMVRLA